MERDNVIETSSANQGQYAENRLTAEWLALSKDSDQLANISSLARDGESIAAAAKNEAGLRKALMDSEGSTDNQYRAQLLRQLAAVYLASAYSKQQVDPAGAATLIGGGKVNDRVLRMESGGSKLRFDGALECLDSAARLDPSNSSTNKLKQISKDILGKLPEEYRSRLARYHSI